MIDTVRAKTNFDFVTLSVMVTTTVHRFTGEIAGKWGADGYAPNAGNVLQNAINMVS